MGRTYGRSAQLLPLKKAAFSRHVLTALGAFLISSTAVAADQVERIIGRISNADASFAAPDLTMIRDRCGMSGLCVGQYLLEHHPQKARIVKKPHPSADQIRRVNPDPGISLTGQTLMIQTFNASTVRELKKLLGSKRRIQIDLSQHQGGDINRMNAVFDHLAQQHMARSPAITNVIIGNRTASAALLLADKLVRSLRIPTCGTKPNNPTIFRKTVIPLDHDHQLWWQTELGDDGVGDDEIGWVTTLKSCP